MKVWTLNPNVFLGFVTPSRGIAGSYWSQSSPTAQTPGRGQDKSLSPPQGEHPAPSLTMGTTSRAQGGSQRPAGLGEVPSLFPVPPLPPSRGTGGVTAQPWSRQQQGREEQVGEQSTTELGGACSAFLLSLTSPGARGLFSANTVTKATAY